MRTQQGLDFVLGKGMVSLVQLSGGCTRGLQARAQLTYLLAGAWEALAPRAGQGLTSVCGCCSLLQIPGTI